MSILGKLFGSSDHISKGLDMVSSTGDALVFTKEEKAEWKLKLLQAYEPFKLAQRLLSLVVGIPFVFIHILACVLMACGVETASEVAKSNNETLGLPFSLIVGFYFGGGAIEGALKAGKKK